MKKRQYVVYWFPMYNKGRKYGAERWIVATCFKNAMKQALADPVHNCAISSIHEVRYYRHDGEEYFYA